jgi:hypothetical protein
VIRAIPAEYSVTPVLRMVPGRVDEEIEKGRDVSYWHSCDMP